MNEEDKKVEDFWKTVTRSIDFEKMFVEIARNIVEHNRKVMYPFTNYADYEKYGDMFPKFEPKQSLLPMVINN